MVGQVLLYFLCDKGTFGWWTKPGNPDSLYVDDVALFVENPHALSSVIELIQYVGCFTGLTLNLDKTIAFAQKVHGCHGIHGIQMGNEPIKYLGAYLGIGDLTTLNFEKPLHLARQKIKHWNSQSLTLQARVLVSKTFIFSLFTHILNSVFITNDQIDLLQKLLNSFIWRE